MSAKKATLTTVAVVFAVAVVFIAIKEFNRIPPKTAADVTPEVETTRPDVPEDAQQAYIDALRLYFGEDGPGGETGDTDAAYPLFLKAAQAGHPEASYAVGLYQIDFINRDERYNPAAASSWFDYAGKHGVAIADIVNGQMYMVEHYFGKADFETAKAYWARAAKSDENFKKVVYDYFDEVMSENITDYNEIMTRLSTNVTQAYVYFSFHRDDVLARDLERAENSDKPEN